ncbi:3-oxoacyl-ACP reductase [Acinetobacter sp. MD2(2019)]|uniref:3-oxoacyl-ACP reductase n=1 Tax=Acinetobacter sp. MD2(2019) TaxID=2605273 RepID=UPI002D1EF274|nr:3-oxoacyl-ACP reductase [Acinetobacter sp. MD2(2019)]MEB3752757.1 3-oxoacyl-ACP reductase [Acinetobacter sp. MD2(2019)]
MTDQYQLFSKTPIGKFVIKNLGLPTPLVLERFENPSPVIKGAVLLGAAKTTTLSSTLAEVLNRIHANCYLHQSDLQQQASKVGLQATLLTEQTQNTKFKALVFDASGIEDAADLSQVYEFFHPVARQVQSSGRVIVFAKSPEKCKAVAQAVAQRALVGFVKSVGKEFKKGITAQVVYVDDGAEQNIESTFRFLLSARSAYVSGQVIRISKADVVEVNWVKPLDGKVAVVTGASRGIGEAIAHVLARDGAHVICLDVPAQQADLERVATDIQGSTLALDITATNAGEEIAKAVAALGGLDILVHNAGITRDKTLAKMTADFWNLVININVSAAERINQYLLEHNVLNPQGRIVCVSSISGIAGNLGQTNYATSKAAVIGLVQFTAPTLTNGITINAVAPGFIETQMTAAIPFAIREAGRRMNSMSQGGLPVDVAEGIAWFATAASSGLNGNVIRVCGQSLLGA